jgi:cytosine/adenosine deaminase-related metal-dependent hydrolase
MTVSLHARVVFPVDGPPIHHGTVTIEGERIVAVDSANPGRGTRDLGHVALLPGLVNAHTHLEFSSLRQPLGEPGMGLADWIRRVISEREKGVASPEVAIATGLAESVAAGVTTTGEIAKASLSAYRTSFAVHLTLFSEVIGFSRARAASALAAAEQRLASADLPPGDFELGLSPHAPYTVSPELLRRLVTFANGRNLPLAMHLAESADELRLLAEGRGPFQELLQERSMWDESAIPRGSRPLDYLQALAAGTRSLVIHGNYLDAQERAFLAEHAGQMSLVYCPRTHAYFGHPPYLLPESLSAGVRVVLGTDSRASNPDLDLLADMRYVADKYPTIAPHAILRMATLDGARALGREPQLGSLTPGKWADIVALPLPKGASGTPDNLLAAIFDANVRPCAVWLRGRELTLESAH